MALISNEKIESIRSKVSIVEVLSEYLQLEKRGRNFWAVCPFHQDSHPSMSISPEKQIYRCFACSAGGNVFTFLQEYKNISFIEALKIVAEKANVSLTELQNYQEVSRYSEEDKKIFAINELAKTFFMNNLQTKKGLLAKQYLEERDITNEDILAFDLGYADSNSQSLYNFLLKKGYTINEIEQAGLVNINGKGQIYDYFNDRVMFPIHDDENNIIGFSGRLVQEKPNLPKYLNTLETKVFKKEQVMYNFYRAKPFIKKSGNLILLEGYMDIISLNRIGIKNTVALMGTNLSDYHINAMKKVTPECIIFLDGDLPGVKASLKAAGKLLVNNFKVKVVYNETGKDPDELVKAGEEEFITKIITGANYPVNFAINYFRDKYNLEDANELAEFLTIVGNLVKVIPDPIEKELSINNLAKVTKLSPTAIAAKIDNLKSNLKPVSTKGSSKPPVVGTKTSAPREKANYFIPDEPSSVEPINPPTSNEIILSWKPYRIKNLKRYTLAEEKMILQLLFSRQAMNFYQLKIGALNNNNYRLIANDIIDYYNRHLAEESVNINMLCDEINDGQLNAILMTILNKSTLKTKYNKKALEDYAILINDYANEKEIEILRKKMTEASTLEEKQVISNEVDNLNQRLKFKKG
ncbi:DNA primase [Spiroplasma syrphidicola EA-1]|uniref:DNA primase n=1 Tax=Spiroplasma syrphidicola EA-1 TaxID=1276229 RepID=R4U3G0_9MOLU|nr:DNA primase [Spiroplasma syrphidicola]AGM25942.1 DNA primase [Spiroplasma syrphidicola EA-1]